MKAPKAVPGTASGWKEGAGGHYLQTSVPSARVLPLGIFTISNTTFRLPRGQEGCARTGLSQPHRLGDPSSVRPKCLFSSSSFPAQQDFPRELLLRPQFHRIPWAIHGSLKPPFLRGHFWFCFLFFIPLNHLPEQIPLLLQEQLLPSRSLGDEPSTCHYGKPAEFPGQGPAHLSAHSAPAHAFLGGKRAGKVGIPPPPASGDTGSSPGHGAPEHCTDTPGAPG